MLKKFFKHFNSDRGDSLVSAIIVFPLVIMFIITGVDYSIYMANRGQIQGIARDAARTVAIMGGDGNATKTTPIEKAYGQTRSNACSGLTTADKAYSSNSSAIECNVIQTLKQSSGLVNVTITGVTCSPEVATFIGERVSCSVTWKYNGIPGSGLGFINSNNDNVTSGTSESEVKFTTNDLVSGD